MFCKTWEGKLTILAVLCYSSNFLVIWKSGTATGRKGRNFNALRTFLTRFAYVPLLQLTTSSSLSLTNSKFRIADMFLIPNLWFQLHAYTTWRRSYVYNLPRLSVHKILLIFPVTHYLHQLNTKLRTHSMQLTSIVNTQITIRVASPRESLYFHVVYQE